MREVLLSDHWLGGIHSWEGWVMNSRGDFPILITGEPSKKEDYIYSSQKR
jgi:hypothetical protein